MWRLFPCGWCNPRAFPLQCVPICVIGAGGRLAPSLWCSFNSSQRSNVPPCRSTLMANIDFNQALAAGVRSYDRHVGRWWVQRTTSAAHAEAYANISSYVARQARKRSGLIVDYACGAGLLTKQLAQLLPRWRVLGIDGSRTMLRHAETWAGRMRKDRPGSLEWLYAKLPHFSLPVQAADIVVFAFPNIITGDIERRHFEWLYRADSDEARFIAAKQGKTGTDTLYDQLFMNRVIARNLRGLLRKGGLCVRVDYSQGDRHELTRQDRLATLFEEGSLNVGPPRLRSEPFFTLVRSCYYPSEVIRDVYEQTEDEDFLEGGYSVSLLKAL
ncbi:MAG: class I SAM-dependent methyltransferase [Nitrospirae bacterium]|nr:MAG: class I SAM-dependent methyltransferase [Nitrospirota bacterium]